MRILLLRYLLFGFQFLASILILEKLSVNEIYIFGIFQTLLGTMLYAQFGLPQYFTKVNINYIDGLSLKKSLNSFLGAQLGISIILFPFIIILTSYYSISILIGFIIAINFLIISLFNIFGSYFRIKNDITYWLLTLSFYTVITALYLFLIPNPSLINLFYIITSINLLLLLIFYKRTLIKIKSFKFYRLINKAIIQLVMNLGAPFLIIINRYLALSGSESNFKLYQEVFVILMAAGLVVNSISQLLSVKLLKLISKGITDEQKWIADNLLFSIIFVTFIGYLFSYLIPYKYTDLFTNNVLIYFCFIMPSLVLFFYNYLIVKNKEIYSLVPLAFSLLPYLFNFNQGPYFYLLLSMIIYSISFIILIYFFIKDSSKIIVYLTLRNIFLSSLVIVALYFFNIYLYIFLLLFLIIYKKRFKQYFRNFIRFYKNDTTFYV